MIVESLSFLLRRITRCNKKNFSDFSDKHILCLQSTYIDSRQNTKDLTCVEKWLQFKIHVYSLPEQPKINLLLKYRPHP